MPERRPLSLPDEPLARTARRWRLPPADLLDAAAMGAFPPQAAWPRLPAESPDGGWVFSRDLTRKLGLAMIDAGVVHVPSIPSDAAQITIGFCDRDGLFDVLDWCRWAQPDPLAADAAEFSWWCSHQPGLRDPGPPAPALTARRFSSVTAWLDALTISGLHHNRFADGLRLVVARR